MCLDSIHLYKGLDYLVNTLKSLAEMRGQRSNEHAFHSIKENKYIYNYYTMVFYLLCCVLQMEELLLNHNIHYQN